MKRHPAITMGAFLLALCGFVNAAPVPNGLVLDPESTSSTLSSRPPSRLGAIADSSRTSVDAVANKVIIHDVAGTGGESSPSIAAPVC